MIPHTRKYFLLIVHHGLPQVTANLLSSILRGTLLPDNVVVIDHGSLTDRFNYEHALVQVVRSTNNGGYAAGLSVGLGILLAQGARGEDIVVCMNNDVRLAPGTMDRLRDFWAKTSGLVLVGAKAGRVNLFTGRTKLITGYSLLVTRYQLPYIHGSFFSAPFKLFMKVPLPEEYFMYWEDVGFSQSVQRQGIFLRVVPGLDVVHNDQPDKPSPTKLYYLVRNGALLLEGQTPWLWRQYWTVLNRLRYSYHLLGGRPTVRRALQDALNNKKGPIRR